MKKNITLIIFISLFVISLGFNIYLGVTSFIKSTYTPDLDDRDLLAEMTKMVIDSEEYQEIASNETIYAIDTGVSRFNVADPSSIFHYEVIVKTDKQSYSFTCDDEPCSTLSHSGSSYSRYSEEKTLLPLD
ncbi:hypothetical protein SH601_14325 [Gracilibacillus sp. S3-1-1]|uniref:Uncharacterized protein n=1 Tax=Gracilibacillus pellucidus TaxID=3095368 RepID=A0ACC6M869_9BACI|nr:hypothetical protein [Gracilibacillus sp. S3-1-1]MDX8047164.1 hypothetical protein [Gracilibacillus sp. S3-1-1]